jgi:hypothetical protein
MFHTKKANLFKKTTKGGEVVEKLENYGNKHIFLDKTLLEGG